MAEHYETYKWITGDGLPLMLAIIGGVVTLVTAAYYVKKGVAPEICTSIGRMGAVDALICFLATI